MAKVLTVPFQKFELWNQSNKAYMPVKSAIAAIKAKKPKIIPIATNVSPKSPEYIFFIINRLNNNK